MIKNVIFDNDGVLICSNDVYYHFFQKIGAEYGLNVTKEFYGSVTGGGLSDSANAFVNQIGISPKDASMLVEEIRKQFTKFIETDVIPLKPGVIEILTYLKEHDINRYVASSSVQSIVERGHHQTGIYEYFNGRIYGDMVKERKPDPEIYLSCMEQNHLKKEETIIIEDSMNGIIAAHRAGVRCIGVPDMFDISEWEEKGYCVICNNLFEAIKYIEKENQK